MEFAEKKQQINRVSIVSRLHRHQFSRPAAPRGANVLPSAPAGFLARGSDPGLFLQCHRGEVSNADIWMMSSFSELYHVKCMVYNHNNAFSELYHA